MVNRIFSLSKNFTVKAVTIVTLATVILSSCKKNEGDNGASFGNRSTAAADYSQSSLPVVTVSGDITTAVSWTAGNVYEISGVVTVRSGGSLTIAAGTFIKSTVNSAGSANGVLVIAKDGTINAVGTSSNPIVFTSRYLLDGNNATVGTPGDFGGAIILGNSTVNTASGTSSIEGLPAGDPRFVFGGSTVGDNRGNFQYVRIEYAGFQLAPNIEVNGLTLGGVGSGTTVNNVEVAWGLDDGFEFFGGTVSTSDLVAFSNDDDQFDFDLGYVGTLANSIAIANKASSHSASSGNSDSNGAEIDNNPTVFTATPTTHPTFDNVRIIGTLNTTGINPPGFKNGITVRRGGEMDLINSIVTGYNIGLRIDANATAANTVVALSSLHGFTAPFDPNAGTSPWTPTFTDGTGNTYNNGTPALSYGITQPFFNESGFNPDLTYGWVKFNY